MGDEHKFPSQLAERFQVRMPDGLRDRIAEAAQANNRSMNSEIVARLEGSFQPPKDDEKLETFNRMIDSLMSRIEDMERRIGQSPSERENAN